MGLPIGSIVVPFCGLIIFIGSRKVIPKKEIRMEPMGLGFRGHRSAISSILAGFASSALTMSVSHAATRRACVCFGISGQVGILWVVL